MARERIVFPDFDLFKDLRTRGELTVSANSNLTLASRADAYGIIPGSGSATGRGAAGSGRGHIP